MKSVAEIRSNNFDREIDEIAAKVQRMPPDPSYYGKEMSMACYMSRTWSDKWDILIEEFKKFATENLKVENGEG